MNSMKEKLVKVCLFLLDDKIKSINFLISQLMLDAKNDSKSSAGDKHETSRSMMQAEQEKLYNQLKETIEQKNELGKIGVTAKTTIIFKGSLVTTNNGIFFIAIAFGKINFEGNIAFIISPFSPLGLKFLGLKENDEVDVNGKKYQIEKIE